MKNEISFSDAFNTIEEVLGKYGSQVELGETTYLHSLPYKFVTINRDGHKINLSGVYDGKFHRVYPAIFSTEYIVSAKHQKIREALNMINPSIIPASFRTNKESGNIILKVSYYNSSNEALEMDFDRRLKLLLKHWDKYYPVFYKIISEE